MRTSALSCAVVLLLMMAPVGAQAPGFEDVPPWHWASNAVQRSADAGIFNGYPPNDPELALNAVAQVYDAFAHPTHPEAQAWAERFLTNLPPHWPQPLQRSRVIGFTLNPTGRIPDSRTVLTLDASVRLRRNGGTAVSRARFPVEILKNGDGRWQVNYGTLAAGQPDVFR